jgi:hypothetical protein
MLALMNLSLFFIAILWHRDGMLPVFELGTICVMATALYSVFPLLNFLSSGLTWTILSDGRLLEYDPSPEDVGGFAWRHVLYLLSFVVTYLYTRGRASCQQAPLKMPNHTMRTAIVLLFSVLTVYFWILQIGFGVSYAPSYEDLRAERGLPTQLPYVLQQFSHNFAGIVFILKQSILLLLLPRWQNKKWRSVLVMWLSVEVLIAVLRKGARTEMILLLLSTALLYHRIVRPLPLLRILLMGGICLGGFLWLGIARNISTNEQAEIIAEVLSSEDVSLLSINNEFQALFGTAYDLYRRKNEGDLGPVPWQIYFSELYLVIPGQLLPFEKWDPAEWYLELIGLRNLNVGYMFSVVSQAIIGLDWVELAVRGALLGWLFAWTHRWYVRHASAFWAALFYLYLCVWSYYTFRATTFYLIYFIVYHFVPTVFLVRFSHAVLSGASHRMAARGR